MSEEVEVLFDCARYNDLETLKTVISGKSLVVDSLIDEYENTLAHYSAANNSLDVLRFITDNSSKEYFDSKNESGNTPLHWASLNGHAETVKHLLSLGCDYNAENLFGLTPVDEAIRREFTEVMEIYSSFCTPSDE